MRKLLLTLALSLPFALLAQTAPPLAVAPPAQIQADLRASLLGEWTGVLEYRDYSEPDTSTKRVQLPTWLSITSAGEALQQYFLYDDGPNKVVDEKLKIALDVAASTYVITNDHGRVETYHVTGYDGLHGGRGDLIITGPTIDNGRPAETRIVLTIRRNLLAWTEENRPTVTAPYVFRHRYVFTRAQAPKLTPTR
jgi:hypothetical protein